MLNLISNHIKNNLNKLKFMNFTQQKYYQTNAGTLEILISNLGIFESKFINENINSDYKIDKDIKIFLKGSDFQCKVWRAVLQIPAGKTATYQEIAQNIGHSNAHRAVANALANNKIAYFIPCHRVIRKDGSLGGYKWGIEKKKVLLDAESSK